MLIRWASDEGRVSHGLENEAYRRFDVVVAVDRMAGRCLGIGAFARAEKSIDVLQVMDEQLRPLIVEKLRQVMETWTTLSQVLRLTIASPNLLRMTASGSSNGLWTGCAGLWN